MQIKLSFPIFNANQLFSPIISEHRNAKERLKYLSFDLQIQLKRHPKYPSKKLPAHITITFLINRDNFDTSCLFLLAHSILSVLRLTMIIQDINNRCISDITINHRFVENLYEEGCVIDFKD